MGTCPPTINQARQLPTPDFKTCTHMACPTDTFSGIVTSTCLRRMPRDPPPRKIAGHMINHGFPMDFLFFFEGGGGGGGIGGNTALGSYVFFLFGRCFWCLNVGRGCGFCFKKITVVWNNYHLRVAFFFWVLGTNRNVLFIYSPNGGEIHADWTC